MCLPTTDCAISPKSINSASAVPSVAITQSLYLGFAAWQGHDEHLYKPFSGTDFLLHLLHEKNHHVCCGLNLEIVTVQARPERGKSKGLMSRTS